MPENEKPTEDSDRISTTNQTGGNDRIKMVRPLEGDRIRTTQLPEGAIEKRSRYCKHGNVWGRCPHGC